MSLYDTSVSAKHYYMVLVITYFKEKVNSGQGRGKTMLLVDCSLAPNFIPVPVTTLVCLNANLEE